MGLHVVARVHIDTRSFTSYESHSLYCQNHFFATITTITKFGICMLAAIEVDMLIFIFVNPLYPCEGGVSRNAQISRQRCFNAVGAL